jgi:hypothetical protein
VCVCVSRKYVIQPFFISLHIPLSIGQLGNLLLDQVIVPSDCTASVLDSDLRMSSISVE